MMRASLANYIGARIFKSSQSALQALSVVGETNLPLIRHGRSLGLEALVVEDLDVDILAGTPFMASNDIAVRPPNARSLLLELMCHRMVVFKVPKAVRACYLIRAPSVNSTVWPGEFIEVDAPPELLKDSFLAIEPRADSVSSGHLKHTHAWPHPDIVQTVGDCLLEVHHSLSQAFYQIPLARRSMKYCGVVSPFKGVRVYTRCAMGIPGSKTALEELMRRVLSDLLRKGCVAKIADDLYCGGNTPQELLLNWRKTFSARDRCNLRLSAEKTIVCPASTTILGWIWSRGSIHASPHRIAASASCEPPRNVRGLRAFISSFKILGRVQSGCAKLLAPLELLTAGQQSLDTIAWSDELLICFHSCQEALASNSSIVLPKPEDQLWIVTDGSIKMSGLGATLYVLRNQKLHLAGFFSAKFKKHQASWLPCEIEALSIVAAVNHFAPYIIQAKS
ncbi:hypothetical protein ACROYT_G004019 [Oculina patagonica]